MYYRILLDAVDLDRIEGALGEADYTASNDGRRTDATEIRETSRRVREQREDQTPK